MQRRAAPPEGGTPGGTDGPTDGSGPGSGDKCQPDTSITAACEVDPRQQTISEFISLPGIDFNLYYNSSRAPSAKSTSTFEVSIFDSLVISDEVIREGEITVEVVGIGEQQFTDDGTVQRLTF